MSTFSSLLNFTDQAIKDVNANGVFDAGDVVLGEAKAQAIVRRYQEKGADAVYGTSDDTVDYNVIGFKYLE